MEAASNTSGEEFDVFLCFRGPDTRPGFCSFLYHDMKEKGIRVFRDDKELEVGQKKEEILGYLDNCQIYIPIFSPGFASSAWCLKEVERMANHISDPNGKKEMLPILLDLPGENVNFTEFYAADLAMHRKKEMIAILSNLPNDDVNYTKFYGAALDEHRKEEMIAFFSNLPKDDVKYTKFYGAALDEQRKEETIAIFSDLPKDDVNHIKFCRAVLEEHRQKEGPTKVDRWTEALRKVPSNIWLKVDGKDYGLHIKRIVRRVQVLLKVKNRDLPDHLVETDDLEDIEQLLDVDSVDHVRFVILHGTAGIGKSSLAGFIFNQFRSKFNYDCFLKIDECPSLLDIQKLLLSKTVGSTAADVILDENHGKHAIKGGLHDKKVLVVLDNVEKEEQLQNLAGSYDWFGPGSRIVVTVRDEGTIPVRIKGHRSNYKSHKVKEMSLDQAIELFSKHAFTSEYPPNWYELSKEVVLSIGRLPLTLEVVGPLFNPNSGLKWNDTLDELKDARNDKFRNKLKISVDKLDDKKRAIFLDIACFCIGEDKMKASYMWDDGIYRASGRAIKVLCERSLVKIDENNKFWMHDELRDLGRCIVEEENLEDAGKRRWVWIDDNTSDVLTSNKEKPDVRALSLSPSLSSRTSDDFFFFRLVGTGHDFTPEELARFPNLRFLGGERMNFEGDFKDSLPNLRWLSWHDCPLQLGETNLHPEKLVVLDISQRGITHDWGGWSQIKKAKKLKVLDLTGCEMLTQTPDFSEFCELEELVLAGCRELSTIGSSIGKLKMLRTLNIKGCVSLQGLPEEIGSLELLTEIVMPSSFTFRPFNLPKALGNLKSLTRLDARGHHGISQLPESIKGLTNLTHLILRGCQNLCSLPDSIEELKSLVELDLEQSGIRAIPNSIGNMKRLKVIRIGYTKVEKIPGTIGGVEMLEELDARFCTCLDGEFPWEIGSLSCLRILNLYRTQVSTVPPTICDCSSLETLIITSGKLEMLPELPLSLKCLIVSPDEFPVLPDLSSLVHLNHLGVWSPGPSDLFSSLFYSADVVISPWKDAQSIHQLPLSLSILRLGRIPQLPNLCDFESLSVLMISECPMPHFPILEYLERLRELKITSCKFLESTPDLSRLKRLQKLQLISLPKLAEIPGLGELESLKFLDITDCNAIQQLPDLSKLRKLRRLKLLGCEMLRAIEGLRELNHLETVEIKQCTSLERLPDVSAFTELKTCQSWFQFLWDKSIQFVQGPSLGVGGIDGRIDEG